LVVLAIAVVGGGFTWLHSDLGDLRTDIRDIRGSVATISGRLQDTREDLVKSVSAVEQQAATANTKLDSLISEMQRRR
jgi:outer membrane murein-binding lipoprotein Lpp